MRLDLDKFLAYKIGRLDKKKISYLFCNELF
jgi:hypothetical protein